MLSKLIWILPCLIFANSKTFCQSVVNSAGQTLRNRDFIIEYSVGEVSISTLSTEEGKKSYAVTEGVLQPIAKYESPGCEIINEEFQFFPNPTKDKISLSGNYNWISDYLIYDLRGRNYGLMPFYNNYIDLSKLPAGFYFITLFPGCDNKYKTLKILKQ